MLHHFPVEYGADNGVRSDIFPSRSLICAISTNESHGQFTLRLLTTVLHASLGVQIKTKESDGQRGGSDVHESICTMDCVFPPEKCERSVDNVF